MDSDRLLKIKEVKRLTTKGWTSIDRLEAAGQFPKRIRIGPRSVAWLESEIQKWIKDCANSRNEIA